MRRKIVAGNWKMNLNKNEAFSLFNNLNTLKVSVKVEAIIFPPSVYLSQMASNSNSIEVGSQNCYFESNGAYTGEISAEILKSLGVKYCLVGHSERREIFKETDSDLSKKIDALLSNDIIPIFCFGEKLVERESKKHFQTVLNQITQATFHLSLDNFSKLIFAYEPVWAIGTGKTASSEQAQEMHHFVRNFIAENKSTAIANKLRILYGGSCKPSNAKELFSCPDVDGGLIGGASLIKDEFVELISIASNC